MTPEGDCHTRAHGPFPPLALGAAEQADCLPGSSSLPHTAPNVSLQGISSTILILSPLSKLI